MNKCSDVRPCQDSHWCSFHALPLAEQLATVFMTFKIQGPLNQCDISALCTVIGNCSVFDEELRGIKKDIAASRHFISHDLIDDNQPAVCFNAIDKLLKCRAVSSLCTEQKRIINQDSFKR